MSAVVSRAVRFLYAILAGIFVWFVSLQFNDVDAPLWIAGYGIAALLSMALAFDLRHKALLYIASAYSLLLMIWICTLIPDLQGFWWDGEVEREFGGLSIVLITQLVALPYFRRMSRL